MAGPTALPRRPAHHIGGFLRYYEITSRTPAGGLLQLGGSGTGWHLLPLAQGGLELQSTVGTRQCLTASGSALSLESFAAAAGQQWHVYDVGAGDYVIVAGVGEAEVYLVWAGGVAGAPGVAPPPASMPYYPGEYRWHIRLTADGTDAPGADFRGLVNGGADNLYAAILGSDDQAQRDVALQSGDDASTAQLWSFVDAGGGLYSIKYGETDYALTVAADGDAIEARQYTTAANQRWRVVDAGGGAYRLLSAASADAHPRPLAADDTSLILAAEVVPGDPAQTWRVPAKVATTVVLDGGGSDLTAADIAEPAFLYVRHSGKFAEPLAEFVGGSPALVQASFTGADRQRWELTDVGDGFHKIVNVETGAAMTALGTEAGGGVAEEPYTGDDSQHWRFTEVSGYYTLCPAAQPADATDGTTLYLSVAGGADGEPSLESGARLVLDVLQAIAPDDPGDDPTYKASDSQLWQMTRVETDKMSYTKYYPDLSVKYGLGTYEIGRIYDPVAERGTMGFGWHLAYQYATIKYFNDDPSTKVKVVKLPDAGTLMFVAEDDGSYTAYDSRVGLSIYGDYHLVTLPGGMVYRFGVESGRLEGISDQFGNLVSFSYNESDRIALISDSTRRWFELTYQDNLLMAITEYYSDTAVRTVEYGYEARNVLTSVSLKDAASDDVSKSVTLSYYRQLLHELRDETGNLIEGMRFFRDGKGYGRVMQTYDSMGNVRTYDYASEDKDGGGSIATVRITDARGLVKLNVYDTKAFERTVTDISPAGEPLAEVRIKYTTRGTGDAERNAYNEPEYEIYNGFRTDYTHDANGNVEKTTAPDGSYTVRVYNSQNSVIADVDEVGYGTFHVYAADGVTLQATYRCLGPVDTSGWFAGAILQRVTVETLISNLHVGSPGAPAAAYVRYTYYDPHTSEVKGLVTTMVDDAGTTTFTYNERGLVESVTGPSGAVTSYEYGTNGLISVKASPEGRVTRFEYDASGRVTAEIKVNPDGADSENRREYDNSGRTTADIDANGDVTLYRYWFGSGKVWVKTTPDGHSFVTTYDEHGNVATKTQPGGAAYRYVNDLMGRQLQTFLTLKPSTDEVLLEENTYDDFPGPEGYTSRESRVFFSEDDWMEITYYYDFAGREVVVKSPLGTESNGFYADGRLRSVEDVAGRTRTLTYGPLCGEDDYVSLTEPDGTYAVFTYDSAGRKTQRARYSSGDDLLETIAWTYDQAGNPSAESKNGVLRESYEYDREGNLVARRVYVSYPEGLGPVYQLTTWVYNYLNVASHMIEWVEPDDLIILSGDLIADDPDVDELVGLITLYEYDLAANLISETRANGELVEYAYDAMNRRVSERRGDLANAVRYDWDGRPIWARDMNGNEIVYEYGPRGEETRTAQLIDGHLAVRAAWYDRAGRRIAEVLPSNYPVSQYDSAPGYAGLSHTYYRYNEKGQLEALIYSGKEVTYVPTAGGDTGEWMESTVSRVDRAFAYDEWGNVTKQLDAVAYEQAPGDSFEDKLAGGQGPWLRYDVMGNVIAESSVAAINADIVNGNNRYEYDALGRLVAEFEAYAVVEDAPDTVGERLLSGRLVLYTYDCDDNLTSVQYLEAVISDATTAGFAGSAVSTEPVAAQEFEYDLTGELTQQVHPAGYPAVETYTYNLLGLARVHTLPGDATIPVTEAHFWYDSVGRVVRKLTVGQDASEGREELFRYDAFDRLIEETVQRFPDGTQAITRQWGFDGNGNAIVEVDGNGNLREFAYNELDRQRLSIAKTGEATWVATGSRYDTNGNEIAGRIAVINGSDAVVREEHTLYDYRGQKIGKIDTFGTLVQKVNYSPRGLPVVAYDALNSKTTVEFDADGRQRSITDAEGVSEERLYDLQSRVVEKIDGNGHSTSHDYDIFDRIVAAYDTIDGDRRVRVMEATYDPAGNMTSRTTFFSEELAAGSQVTLFEYNIRDLTVARIDGATEDERVLEYDAYGNTLRTVDRNGSVLEFTYDIHGRKLTQTSSAGTITFEYDGNGNILVMNDQTGRTAYTYDPLGRPLTKNVPVAGAFRYRYDVIAGVATKEGAYADITVDPKGNVSTHIFDQAGRLKTVKDGGLDSRHATVYDYYPTGMRKSVAYPNGYRETFTYYGNYRLETLTNWRADGTALEVYTYAYDDAGYLVEETRVNNNTRPRSTTVTTTYAYDSRNQVTRIEYGDDKVVTYTYDLAGNRTQEVQAETNLTTTSGYTYDGLSRLVGVRTQVDRRTGNRTHTTVELTEYVYDKNGNQIEVWVNAKLAERRTYDPYNQLIEARIRNQAYRYAYDGAGRMVTKHDTGTATHFVYNGEDVVLEVDKGGKQLARNLHGLNLLVRVDQSGEFYYLYNGRGDVMSLVNKSGLVVREYQYDAFGRILDSFRERLNPYRHAGAFWDYQTGLYMLGARAYDPISSRFLQEDPYLGDSQDPLSLNLYAYCRNNPMTYADPTGNFFWVIIIVLAVVGAVLAVGATFLADYMDDGEINTPWYVYVGAGLGGFIAGACAGAGVAIAAGLGFGAAGMMAIGAIAGAVGGTLNTVVQDLFDDGKLNTNWRYYLAAGVTGAILGAVGGYALGGSASAAAGAMAQGAKTAIITAAKTAVAAVAKTTLAKVVHGLATVAKVVAKEVVIGLAIATTTKIAKDLIINQGFDLNWKSWVATLVEGSVTGLIRGAGMHGLKLTSWGHGAFVAGGAALGGIATATARLLSYVATGTPINWVDVAVAGGIGAAAGAMGGHYAYKAKMLQANPPKPVAGDKLSVRFANFRARSDYAQELSRAAKLMPFAIKGSSAVIGALVSMTMFRRFESNIYKIPYADHWKYAVPYILPHIA